MKSQEIQLFIVYLCTFAALISCNANPKDLIFSEEVNIREICKGVFFSPRPYPGDNTFYVGCMRGIPMILRCYENEIFNENLLQCIYQIPETTTQSITTTESTTTTSVQITTTTEPTTTTTQSTTTTTTEPTTTTTEPTTSTTTTEPLTTTTSTTTQSTTTTSTEPTTTTESTTTTKPVNPCEGISSGRIPHPSDCTLCQMCFLQQIMEVECKCEAGQIFWISDCVNGDPETCEPLN
ncbi:uncharacterized protein [Chironomus tepperi]|uniref:uncharacterized protein n=1 Tax=Chironomus tepperi TaxID=113505 RepID=UPI00391F2B7B